MRKYLLFLIILYSFISNAQASELVLSDKIREARELAKLEQLNKIADKQTESQNEVLEKESINQDELISKQEEKSR